MATKKSKSNGKAKGPKASPALEAIRKRRQRRGTAVKIPKHTTLKGFAYLKRYYPERFREISQRAGKTTQTNGNAVRWDRKTAAKMSKKANKVRWQAAKGTKS